MDEVVESIPREERVLVLLLLLLGLSPSVAVSHAPTHEREAQSWTGRSWDNDNRRRNQVWEQREGIAKGIACTKDLLLTVVMRVRSPCLHCFAPCWGSRWQARDQDDQSRRGAAPLMMVPGRMGVRACIGHRNCQSIWTAWLSACVHLPPVIPGITPLRMLRSQDSKFRRASRWRHGRVPVCEWRARSKETDVSDRGSVLSQAVEGRSIQCCTSARSSWCERLSMPPLRRSI
ncbi:uncharacterized protein LOC132874883 [Neoarius graeffei]|uniref:uncharacterized protein LOC132874883 n=1 Tax=Neoarius graeffei TaxID=443677 RepID=UPI00298C89D6|nr:uncharacterized protein LOC132874883 [Neoarius graeffei]